MNQRQEARANAGLNKARQYSADILSGKIKSCKWVKLAVKRNERDLKEAHNRGFVFDKKKAGRALALFGYLRHSKGDLEGQIVELEPWQCWGLSVVFGWVKEATGKRRFRTIYEEVARKNGKTTKLAGIGIKALLKDDEGGPEIYCAATKRDQARIMFDEASAMIQRSAPLRKRLDVQQHRVVARVGRGKIEPLSSDGNSLDGLNPHAALVDELHAHKTSEVWDVLKSALGSRSQPLLWAITTAGFNQNGICYEVRDYACKVLDGTHEDDSFFAVIYTLDDGDDHFDESCWIKANPNLGVSVDLDALRAEARQAKVLPRALVNYLTKHMNIWVSGETVWCNVQKWKSCGNKYSLKGFIQWCKKHNAEVYGGLDLASISDIGSLGLIAVAPDGCWTTWSKNYLPEDTVNNNIQKSHVPYKAWERAEWLTLTPGSVCDYDYIKADIFELCEQLDIYQINFDRWNSSQLVNDLLKEGIPMVGFGQGFVSMNAPMKELERRYLTSEIRHPNDPVLNWSMSNVVALQDPAGNVKPAKDKSKEKIDPSVALIMAAGAAMGGEEQEESVYASGEL